MLTDTPALKRLEAILHPLVRAEARAFLAKQARLRRPLVVLDKVRATAAARRRAQQSDHGGQLAQGMCLVEPGLHDEIGAPALFRIGQLARQDGLDRTPAMCEFV